MKSKLKSNLAPKTKSFVVIHFEIYPSVNLEDLLLYARTLDETERQARGMEGENATTCAAPYAVHKVNSNPTNAHPNQRKTPHPSQHQYTKTSNHHKTCYRCGNSWPHQDNSCPAVGQRCKKCSKMNHFIRVYKSSGKGWQIPKNNDIHNVSPGSQNDHPISESDSDSELTVYAVTKQPKSISKNRKKVKPNFQAKVSFGKSTIHQGRIEYARLSLYPRYELIL